MGMSLYKATDVENVPGVMGSSYCTLTQLWDDGFINKRVNGENL